MYDPDDEAPILELQPVLELDHQYTRFVEAWNEDPGLKTDAREWGYPCRNHHRGGRQCVGTPSVRSDLSRVG
ncbi:hypothetical protein GCM10023317_58830 [Actinopolymorpha pittospori]|uniref:Uncharacterized protein n=1 Tax=Actinopolymorpha pittospori TaxID=648752 RepID=A0A927MPB7_9ACTN|nr:hypothetical protein [Actinopolymorpha pittospori]